MIKMVNSMLRMLFLFYHQLKKNLEGLNFDA